MIQSKFNYSAALKFRLLALFSTFFVTVSSAIAQVVTESDTALNATQKEILKEGKKMVGNKDTWTSIIMIMLVLAVVGVAIWLSFRSPDSQNRRKKVLERQQKRGHQA